MSIRKNVTRTIAIGLGLAAIVTAAVKAGGPSTPSMATATLMDARGHQVGLARLRQTPGGVLLELDLQAAPAGLHALHVHETGMCDPPSFESAGEHFASPGQKHGFFNAGGPHAGDLPNVHVPDAGRLKVEQLLAGLTIDEGPRSLLDADGAALVLHAKGDDYATDPAGDAGDRLACGAIVRQTEKARRSTWGGSTRAFRRA